MTIRQRFESDRDAIEASEQRHDLPEIDGGPVQSLWARWVRHQFLTELLDGLPDAFDGRSPTEVMAMRGKVDAFRGERAAFVWIDLHRRHLGHVISYAFGLPTPEEAWRNAHARWAKKAIKSNRTNRLAESFEREHSLPPIVIEGVSFAKQNFARRCRYEVLSGICAEHLPEQLMLVRRYLDADFWIDTSIAEQTFLDAARGLGPRACRADAVRLLREYRRATRLQRQLDREFDAAMLRDGAGDGIHPVWDGEQYVGGMPRITGSDGKVEEE
jgi:hypothetical protein